MLLQMLLQKWEWKNKAIPRTPKALKKSLKRIKFYITIYSLKAEVPKLFLKSLERKCFVAHSLTHSNTSKSFSLSEWEWKKCEKSWKASMSKI